MLLGHVDTSKIALRNQVLSDLLYCLEKDPSLFEYWNEIYPRHIAHSNNFLLFLKIKWETENLAKRLSIKNLIQLVATFIKTNQELERGTFLDKKTKKTIKISKEEELKELRMCTLTCQTLLKKIQSGSAFKSLLLAAVPAAFLGALFLSMQCCQIEWCRQQSLLSEWAQC